MKYNVDDCCVINLDKHHSDRKGNLSVVENDVTLPFEVKRIYYLYDVPGGESRGSHAHKELSQLIVAARVLPRRRGRVPVSAGSDRHLEHSWAAPETQGTTGSLLLISRCPEASVPSSPADPTPPVGRTPAGRPPASARPGSGGAWAGAEGGRG